VTFGRHGTYGNVGIPGTGLSARNRIDGGKPTSRRSLQSEAETVNLSITIHLDDDGNVEFRNSEGDPLPENLVRQVKRQKGEEIRQWLSEECDKFNQHNRDLETIHLDTPDPDQKPTYTSEPFIVPEPGATTPKSLGILGRLFTRVRCRIEAENATAQSTHEREMADWRKAKASFESRQAQQRQLIEEKIYSETEAMIQVLENRLQKVTWPRETNVSFQVSDAGNKVLMDVDLPEIEDMPTKIALLPARGWKLSMKQLTDTKKRQIYMNHIHGVGFRLIGEAFATLPTVESVTLSAYSQRPDNATGKIVDEYLYSVHVERDAWVGIDFYNLNAVDMVESLAQFDLRRKMTRTGIFRPIDPHQYE